MKHKVLNIEAHPMLSGEVRVTMEIEGVIVKGILTKQLENKNVITKLNRILRAQDSGEWDSLEAYRQTLILRNKLMERRGE